MTLMRHMGETLYGGINQHGKRRVIADKRASISKSLPKSLHTLERTR